MFNNIKELVINSRNRVQATVNTEMLNLYWNIGKAIMEIQQGEERASYGETVLEKLSQKLTNEFGKGFSKRNLERMRKFYICFPIATTVSSQLSWSHYLELLKIDEETKRNFYIKETINSRDGVFVNFKDKQDHYYMKDQYCQQIRKKYQHQQKKDMN